MSWRHDTSRSTRILAISLTWKSYSLYGEGKYLSFCVKTLPCAPLANVHRWLLAAFMHAFGSPERYYLTHGIPHVISAPPPISGCTKNNHALSHPQSWDVTQRGVCFGTFPTHVRAPEAFPSQILAHAYGLGLAALLFSTVIPCVSNISGIPYILHASSDLRVCPTIGTFSII
jgi:hypothetical protein